MWRFAVHSTGLLGLLITIADLGYIIPKIICILTKCENWQKISLILLTERQFFWTFFALYILTLRLVASKNLVWAHGPDPTWSLEPKVSKIKSFDFPPFFLLWTNQMKIWKWVMFKTLDLVATIMISNVCILYHMIRYNFGPNFFFKIHISPIYRQTNLKMAIVFWGKVKKKILEHSNFLTFPACF